MLQSRQPELGITDEDVKCLRIAGLVINAKKCHDLGHGPFSHLFDNLVIKKLRPDLQWTHEESSEQMLEYLIEENPKINLTRAQVYSN